MTATPYLELADQRDGLIHAAVRLLSRQLPPTLIAFVWPETHCVLFQLTDGRTGSIEVRVNWDIAPRTESLANRSVAQ